MRQSAWTTAGPATLGPLIALIAFSLEGFGEWSPASWLFLGIVFWASMVSVGGVLATRSSVAGRSLSTLGLLASLTHSVLRLPHSPALTLTALLAGGLLVASLWMLPALSTPRLSRRRVRELTAARVQISALLSLITTSLVLLAGMTSSSLAVGAAFASLAPFAGFTIAWMRREKRRGSGRWKWLLGVAGLTALGIALFGHEPGRVLVMTGAVPFTALLLVPSREARALERWSWWQPLVEHPARLLVGTFLALCLLGTLLLSLPHSATTGESIGVIDAAFTAVSAVCVTGLVVLDTPRDFSVIGEAIILLLLQFGGLGIMTFSTAAFAVLGRRLSLRHEGAVAGLVSHEDRGSLFLALRRVLVITFVAEGVGAAVLTGLFFSEGDSVWQAAWRGVFTAVSAFCNAGFALQSDSLVPYRESAGILQVVAVLIILGGLSPATVAALPRLARGQSVPLHVKLALAASVFLLVTGAIWVLALEWTNTLRELSFWDRLHNAWFQSVTLRTAGFNSIDIASTHSATITLMIAFMFIGGSPGGTAGGVKTTTAAILILAVISAIRGRWVATAFGRRIPHPSVYKAASIVTLGALSLTLGLMALQLTQRMSGTVALFEVASALGTVGLSIGGTQALDGVGKLIIIACMFAGRVGPLSLFLFLRGRHSETGWRFVEEEVEVG